MHTEGFVYVLISPNSPFIKIGGTERPLIERLRGINGTSHYSAHGPWQLSDFLQVTDWRLVEGRLHRHFGAKRVADVEHARELFRISAFDARQQLRLVEPSLRVGSDATLELLRHRDEQLYLLRLFALTGLFGNLDIQGAWTFSVYTSTGRGRTFTINIGTHEVAFSGRSQDRNAIEHVMVMDELVSDFDGTKDWLKTTMASLNPPPIELRGSVPSPSALSAVSPMESDSSHYLVFAVR